eukprot:14527253-Alexandrium_andersonii.AAC.1
MRCWPPLEKRALLESGGEPGPNTTQRSEACIPDRGMHVRRAGAPSRTCGPPAVVPAKPGLNA